jgi:hypothetical protein
VAKTTLGVQGLSRWRKSLNILALVPIVFSYFILLFSPAYAEQLTISSTVGEGGILEIVPPTGYKISQVLFASYGTPSSTYQQGWCHAIDSQAIVESYLQGKDYLSIPANNGVFGDPCPGTYKYLAVVLVYEPLVSIPVSFLNPPQNVFISSQNGVVTLSWDAPQDSGVAVERYAVMWSTTNFQSDGWAIASTETSVTLNPSMFETTGGLDKTYQFQIRADNDTLAVYSERSMTVEAFVQSIHIDPTPTPTPTPTQETPTPTATDTPPVTPPATSEPPVVPPSIPTPEPSSPSKSSTPEATQSPTQDNIPSSNDSTDAKVDYILENLVPGDAVSSEMIAELGIDYADLPPDTPVELDNGVVLTAQVADALQVFENPSEIFEAVLTDPSKALTAFANIGADMTPEKRKESQKVIVAAVIAGQVLTTTSMVGRIR